jgi:hypothetical protein
VSLIGDDIFLTGTTMGSVDASFLDGGNGDGFVARFGTDGSMKESKQFGTNQYDEAR